MKVEDRLGLPMLGVDEALASVLGACRPLPPAETPLGEAAGRYLAEEIRAGADLPPFDRSAMDGYALRAADTAAVPAVLAVVEEIAAGHDPALRIGPGQAARIMTGAAIPGGADAVVMVERTEKLADGEKVRILQAAAPGDHIRRAGEDLRRGDLMLPNGAYIGAPEIALLAAEGRAAVRTGGVPRVCVLSTGDELVGVDEAPGGSRIRDTNSWSLAALLAATGIAARKLGIARDEAEALASAISRGLEGDVLFLSGGVSMGEYDLVGSVLRDLGCRPLFQRVAIQPGKPLYFGIAGATLVFGLPGNPVSSLVDFLVFGRPALRVLMGGPRAEAAAPTARLTAPIHRKPGRRGYLPARVAASARGDLEATPIRSMGSADLVALSKANALVVAPENESDLEKGRELPILLLDEAFRR